MARFAAHSELTRRGLIRHSDESNRRWKITAREAARTQDGKYILFECRVFGPGMDCRFAMLLTPERDCMHTFPYRILRGRDPMRIALIRTGPLRSIARRVREVASGKSSPTTHEKVELLTLARGAAAVSNRAKRRLLRLEDALRKEIVGKALW